MLGKYIQKCNAEDLFNIAGLMVNLGRDIESAISASGYRPTSDEERSGPGPDSGGIGNGQEYAGLPAPSDIQSGESEWSVADMRHETTLEGDEGFDWGFDPSEIFSDGEGGRDRFDDLGSSDRLESGLGLGREPIQVSDSPATD